MLLQTHFTHFSHIFNHTYDNGLPYAMFTKDMKKRIPALNWIDRKKQMLQLQKLNVHRLIIIYPADLKTSRQGKQLTDKVQNSSVSPVKH